MKSRWLRLRAALFSVAFVFASVGQAATPATVRADLGNCSFPVDHHNHQGGLEPALSSTSHGIFGIVTVRLPDLCNNPGGSNDTMSTMYVMLRPNSGASWHQIGYWRWSRSRASRVVDEGHAC